jgi:hypothetical protein
MISIDNTISKPKEVHSPFYPGGERAVFKSDATLIHGAGGRFALVA